MIPLVRSVYRWILWLHQRSSSSTVSCSRRRVGRVHARGHLKCGRDMCTTVVLTYSTTKAAMLSEGNGQKSRVEVEQMVGDPPMPDSGNAAGSWRSCRECG